MSGTGFSGAGSTVTAEACMLTDDLRTKSMSSNRFATLTLMKILFLGDICALVRENIVCSSATTR